MDETRTKWPAARHLQQAADQLREPDPNLDPAREFYTAPPGDWLDKAANEMAWLAPYREHEGGYRPWRAATRIAHGVLGLPGPDTCTECHPPRRTSVSNEGWTAEETYREPRADAASGPSQADRVVAHVPTAGTDLHCLRCAPPPLGDIWTAVTAEELEDGGICTKCGTDVLITPAAVSQPDGSEFYGPWTPLTEG